MFQGLTEPQGSRGSQIKPHKRTEWFIHVWVTNSGYRNGKCSLNRKLPRLSWSRNRIIVGKRHENRSGVVVITTMNGNRVTSRINTTWSQINQKTTGNTNGRCRFWWEEGREGYSWRYATFTLLAPYSLLGYLAVGNCLEQKQKCRALDEFSFFSTCVIKTTIIIIWMTTVHDVIVFHVQNNVTRYYRSLFNVKIVFSLHSF